MKIGDISVANRVLLAPMSGITDVPFRRLAAALGAGLVVSEMTASDDLVHGRPMSVLRCEATGIGPHVVQLAGCQTHWMSEGARIAEAGGADIIDINMGCPARHVTGGQSGSALMRDLDHALKLIEATIAAVKIPVTLKMRLGWDHGSLNAPELARRAEAAGVQMITVHGRTRCQFYKGEADWSAVRAVKDAISVPLVVNGDITSFEKAVSALGMSDADAVMIGRGAQGQPWLPGQIGRQLETGKPEAAPSLAEQLAHIRALYDEVCRLYGLRIGLKHARKHLGWALEIAAECSRAPAEKLKSWRQKILTSEDPHRVHRSLQDAYDDFAWSAAA
ncbi:tRNA dihydrouridine synthase DusB [Bradyrhizobium sp. AUGA SZCCT0240]|uniref:tRNA dihydrouridine synthase DusB n=1 Tax=unclassified Bradyrhizobium TaxID=2631580 RepID=UPI001BA81405|nr:MULTISPECIES: tRNA dihydrouridine synthase DusB [unclassified Bradyrhizobium]MBR1196433.1 tRNA dihydrouridine synthase DusB [Bradyrhizobium sp. AUGA SZCCT0158]MBR1241625.1 tRNA dihydrouridine synthase DusB [Bradyrhizobium sp. AUGA SZCCT0274]MBR1254651.1 tRNA dihydrouridine synthase DusB [Bradyrhizobium sp. AUGA SZCCT0240]